MAKTYNTIPTVSTGDVYAATAHNNIVTNVNNYRVPPMARATRNSTQSIASAGWGVVNWNTEAYDTDSMFSPTSNVITVGTTGVHVVTACINFSSNATGARLIALHRNPTITGSGDTATITTGFSSTIAEQRTAALNGFTTTLSVSATFSMSAGDTVAVAVYQTSGGALNIIDTSTSSDHLAVTWLGQVS